MAANGRLIWAPAGVKGLRITGWENKIGNMPESATSDYATLNVYILDDVDTAAGAQVGGNAAQLIHAQFCNNMRNAFGDTVADCRVHSVRMQNGQKSKQLLEFIETELQNKTEDDLVVFCFQGIAGGDGNGYNFINHQLRGSYLAGPGPNRVNAHKPISKVNESSADCLLLLDCFFPTHSIQQWKREDHITEIILAGTEMHNVNGRATSGTQGFDEAFLNSMRDILANPRGESRQTIPRIMGRDTSLCWKPIRHWLNRPNRMHPGSRVWHIFVDVGRMKDDDGDKLRLRRCEVTGRRRGEFGADPELDSDGWGSDGDNGSAGDSGDGDGDCDGGGDGEGSEGGGEDDDGDDSNGGWGRGFGRARHRESREDTSDAGDEDKSEGYKSNRDSVATNWTRLCRSLDLPSKLSDAEAIDLVHRLQSLPKQPRRKQRSANNTPSNYSNGIRKKARGKRPVPVGNTAKDRSDFARRPNAKAPVTPDCEITSVQRLGHELGSPIVLIEDIEVSEGNDPVVAKDRVNNWLQQTQGPFLEDGDNEVIIKRSESSAAHDTGAFKRESSVDSDLESAFVGPAKRKGRGVVIDLDDQLIDLTEDPESLFIPEQTGGDDGN